MIKGLQQVAQLVREPILQQESNILGTGLIGLAIDQLMNRNQNQEEEKVPLQQEQEFNSNRDSRQFINEDILQDEEMSLLDQNEQQQEQQQDIQLTPQQQRLQEALISMRQPQFRLNEEGQLIPINSNPNYNIPLSQSTQEINRIGQQEQQRRQQLNQIQQELQQRIPQNQRRAFNQYFQQLMNGLNIDPLKFGLFTEIIYQGFDIYKNYSIEDKQVSEQDIQSLDNDQLLIKYQNNQLPPECKRRFYLDPQTQKLRTFVQCNFNGSEEIYKDV